MAASVQVFSLAYSFIDGKLDQFLNADVTNVIAQVAGPLRAALVLYVLLYGFAILRGAISEPIVDFSIRSLKLAFIYMLATTVAYSSWVTQPLFHTLPDTLTQAISGAAAPDVGSAFDNFLGRAGYLSEKIAKTATLTDWAPLLLSGVVYVVGALAAALGFGVVIIAKVTLALLVALGPIFIACALFDASRRFFFGWLGQAVNYIVLMALIITVFQMILAMVSDQWATIDGMEASVGGGLFIALSILGAIFFLQTPAIAAGIAGGASSGLADFGNAIGMAFGGRMPSFAAPTTRGGATQAPRNGGALRPVGSKV
jgi:type IV secretion system protein VirB6